MLGMVDFSKARTISSLAESEKTLGEERRYQPEGIGDEMSELRG